MKTTNNITITLTLLINLFFSVMAFGQEQVTLKVETTETRNLGPSIKPTAELGQYIVFMIANNMTVDQGDYEWINVDFADDKILVQDISITYTQESMYMVAIKDPITPPGPSANQYQIDYFNEYTLKNTLKMMLRFNPEGTKLTMIIKVPGQNTMSINVPKGNTISSNTLSSQLSPAPIDNTEIIGYEAGKYTFTNESILDLDETIGANLQKLKRVDHGEVWLAPDAPGIGLMRGFYLNLKLGGYDLGGAENGGIMALLDRLLDIGVPLKSIEKTTFFTESPEYVYKIITETKITGIALEPLDEELGSDLNSEPDSDASENSENPEYTMDSQGNAQSSTDAQTANSSSNTQAGSTGSSSNNGNMIDVCDCSCEKFTEYMKISKMSKKEKKNMDMSQMQAMDMNCIKKCIPEWTKCVSIKN